MPHLSAISLSEAAHACSVGRVVAFPTGTSYGLAADAMQGFALQRVRNLKKRPLEKSFTIFMDPSLWDQYLVLQSWQRTWLERLTEKPATVLVKPKAALAHLAQAGLVGVRIIDHPVMLDLARTTLLPLTATSANISNEPACLSPACVQEQFRQEVADHTYDLSLAGYLDAGVLPASLPSTIIRPYRRGYKIVREGALPAQFLDTVKLGIN